MTEFCSPSPSSKLRCANNNNLNMCASFAIEKSEIASATRKDTGSPQLWQTMFSKVSWPPNEQIPHPFVLVTKPPATTRKQWQGLVTKLDKNCLTNMDATAGTSLISIKRYADSTQISDHLHKLQTTTMNGPQVKVQMFMPHSCSVQNIQNLKTWIQTNADPTVLYPPPECTRIFS